MAKMGLLARRLPIRWTLCGLVLLALGHRPGPELSDSAPRSTASAATASISDIALPELLAIELPTETTTHIMPTASPLKELLASATAGGLQVTHDLIGPVAAGATAVTWTAWAGTPAQSAVLATKTARIYVFPSGQTPVGVSGDDRATVGNQSAKVVRDGSGRAHMVWLDGGRPGTGPWVMYRRAMVDLQTGALTWETPPLRLSEQPKDDWNSYPAIAASANAVHVAWVGAGTARYRRLVRGSSAWTIEPIRDTRTPGPGPDYGPSIAVRGDDEIHLVTPTGRYALSADGGRTWTIEQVPVPPGTTMKGPSLAVDASGNGHVTFTGQVRSAIGDWSMTKANGGYWQVRYVRRRAGGGWEDSQNILAGLPAWNDRGIQADVVADFIDVAVDRNGAIHVAWHGTVNSGIFGQDETFYMRRPATRPNSWGPWDPPQALHPPNPANGEYESYAPSLAVDANSSVVVATLFFDTLPQLASRFDSVARTLRSGRLEGPPIPLTRSAREAVAAGHPGEAWSTWFPCAAPSIFRDAIGRAWLDVLQTVVPPPSHGRPYFIVYQRREVTSLLRPGG